MWGTVLLEASIEMTPRVEATHRDVVAPVS